MKVMTAEENGALFKEVNVPFINHIASLFEFSDGAMRFSRNKSIVDDIIGGLLFNPDDFEGVTISQALSLI